MDMRFLSAGILLAFLSPDPVRLDGLICRANRDASRYIVMTDQGERVPLFIGESAAVTFEGAPITPRDLLPGEKVTVLGRWLEDSTMKADSVNVRIRIAHAIADALLGIKPRLIGRFAVREAKTEFFSLRLPDGDYIRVDAKAAYGPRGRVRVGTLRSGDLLELDGTWTRERELRASSITILTDREASSCGSRARLETKDQTAAREQREKKFLEQTGDLALTEEAELDDDEKPNPEP